MKDLGLVKYFFGIKVTKTKTGYHINQDKYVKEMLYVFVISDCNPMKEPMIENSDFEIDKSKPVDEIIYTSMMLKLLYAA